MTPNERKLLTQQEFTLWNFINVSLRIFLDNFSIIALMGLILSLPLLLFSAFSPEDLSLPILFVATGIELILTTLLFLSLYRVVLNFIEQRDNTISQALTVSIRQLPAGMGTALISLIIVGLLLMLIIPGIIWGIYYSFALFVVADKGKSGWTALKASQSLVMGRWWKVLGYTFMVVLLSFSVITVISYPLSFVFTTQAMYLILAPVAAIAYSFIITAQITLYINLKHNAMPSP